MKLSEDLLSYSDGMEKDVRLGRPYNKGDVSAVAGYIKRKANEVAKLEEELANFRHLSDERLGITEVDGVRGIDMLEGVKAYFKATDKVFKKKPDEQS